MRNRFLPLFASLLVIASSACAQVNADGSEASARINRNLSNGQIPTEVTTRTQPATDFVTLVNVSVKSFDGYNRVSWTTAPAKDVQRYVVEFSNDGEHYQQAGEVSAIFSNDGKYYYDHEFVNSGVVSYRLRIIATDGRYFYSPDVRVGKGAVQKINVYPTIVTTGVVNVDSPEAVENIEIVSAGGQRILLKNMNGQKGYLRVPVSSAPRGIYFIAISGKTWKQTERIVVQ